MSLAPAPHQAASYSSTQIALHWIVAALVAVNWFLGEPMAHIFDAREEGEAITSYGAAYAHIIIGLAVLTFMVARLLARLRRPVATEPSKLHPVLATVGTITHWLMYALLLLIPLGGLLAWFGRNEAVGELHGTAVDVLLVLVALHLAGAVLHLILGENLFKRMWRGA